MIKQGTGILRLMAARTEEWSNSLQLHTASLDLTQAFGRVTPTLAVLRAESMYKTCVLQRRLRQVDQAGSPFSVQSGEETPDATVGGKWKKGERGLQAGRGNKSEPSCLRGQLLLRGGRVTVKNMIDEATGQVQSCDSSGNISNFNPRTEQQRPA